MAKILRNSSYQLTPINGSVVCCHIFGAFMHTGIWVNGGIVELAGSGLVRSVSPTRFLHNRTGEQIFTMGDDRANILSSDLAAVNAQQRIFEYVNYDVIANNCNRFVASCFDLDNTKEIMLFEELTENLANFFNRTLVFYPTTIVF